MGFALGFAGGFADTAEADGGYGGGYADAYGGAQPEPEPTPGIIGRGSGVPQYRTRWVPRPGQPAPPPVRLAVSVHVDYRWSAAVTRIYPKVRLAQAAPRLSFKVTSLTMWLRTPGVTARTTAKVVKVDVDQVTLSRFAYEVRELNEIAVALTAWQ